MAGNLLPSIRFIKGNSKNPLVPGVCIVGGRYKFYFNKIISDGENSPLSLFYQCGNKKSTKCAASMVLVKNDEKWWPQNMSTDEVHNHASDRPAILAEIMKKEMYAKVSERPETKSDDAFRDVITEFEDRHVDEEMMWDQAIANLTEKGNMARHMRRIRNKEYGPLPKNRNDFDPEAVIRDTLGGQKVIVMDSNKNLDKNFYRKLEDFKNKKTSSSKNDDTVIGLVDYSISSIESNDDTVKPKRIISYTTEFLLKLFNQRKCSGDGTFKICPALWKQLYVTMVKFAGSWIPVCYSLLPDKSQESYFTMFYMLKKQIKDMKLPFNIESIRSDFEIAEMKAAIAALNVEVKGCYFHFTQSGWKFVQNNNMASAYLSDNDQEFKLFIQCVLSLPHVPVEDVQDTLDILRAKDWEFGESNEKFEFKEKFLNYIQEYWVDGVYPPQVWNCFRRKVDLTNNNNEAHNSYLAHAVKEAHPSPVTLTVALVKELTIAETKVRKIKSGAKRVLKQKYKDLNTRRDNLKSMYNSLERVEYLSQIGNIVMHINLNKGQMSELKQARRKNVSENDLDDSDLDTDNVNVDIGQSSGASEASIESNRTNSSEEISHCFRNRVIGQAVKNGKEVTEYVEPEYKGKRCLVCKGKFNIKSKYHVCKLCDRLIHVNNNKKCYKMRRFSKDDNFICCDCKEHADEKKDDSKDSSGSSKTSNLNKTFVIPDHGQEELISSFNNQDDDDRDLEDELNEEGLDIDNHTKGGEESINLADYTINGEQCEGLVFRILESPVTEDQVRCEVCAKTFQGKEVLKMHMDEMHFNACPICEKSFYRSVDKVSIQNKRISQNVKENSIFFRSLGGMSILGVV